MGENDQRISLLERLIQHAADHGPVQRLLRRGPRRVRRARPRGSREPVQPQRRPLSLSQHPAGLQPVQHLDPRLGVDHGRLCGSSWSSCDRGGRGTGAVRRPGRDAKAMLLKAARATCDFYLEPTPTRRRALLGHRRARLGPAGRLPGSSGRPVQRPRAGRQFGRRHRARACCGWGTTCSERGRDRRGPALLAGRPDGAADVARRAVSEHCSPSTRGCCCTRFTIGRAAGTTSRPAHGSPRGESCMWGDYHLREVALYLQRIIRGEPYYTFFGSDRNGSR